MTRLTPDDIALLIFGMILTRPARGETAVFPPNGQEERIVAVLRDESDTQMLLDVARGDIEMLEIEKDEMRSDVARWRWEE